jgi:hypothetical protein
MLKRRNSLAPHRLHSVLDYKRFRLNERAWVGYLVLVPTFTLFIYRLEEKAMCNQKLDFPPLLGIT